MCAEITPKIPQIPDNLFGQSVKSDFVTRKSLVGIRSPLEGP